MSGMFQGALLDNVELENFFGGMGEFLLRTAQKRGIGPDELNFKMSFLHDALGKSDMKKVFKGDKKYDWVPGKIKEFQDEWKRGHDGWKIDLTSPRQAQNLQYLVDAIGLIHTNNEREKLRQKDLTRWGDEQLGRLR